MSENLYRDTRGTTDNPLSFSNVVVQGMAPGGGLYVPERIPSLSLDEILTLAKLTYAQRAAYIYKAFDIDLDAHLIDELMTCSYGSQFDTEAICPITSLNDTTHVLELWHGPTAAFKDMALQCLPRFFSACAQLLHERGEINHDFLILVATSGDTGTAALEGFRDIEGVSVGSLYPYGGVSDIQFKQMATQRGKNVRAWGVRGDFDACQTGVKRVFADKDFADRLMCEHRCALSSANSINWGRLMPQIVYYASSYAELVYTGKVSAGDPIDVCVPTGNFGNILAAFYARRMGVPIERLLCASNENRILTDFINTGTYDITDRRLVLTATPSMDILVSSNLERLLFELSGRNSIAIAEWMKSLHNNRKFRVDKNTFARVREVLVADSVDDAECLATIRTVFNQYNYLIDPHTAVAYRVAENLRGSNPVLVVSTAYWAKFGANVYRALHGIQPNAALPEEIEELTGCALNELLARETGGQAIPKNLAQLDSLPVRFFDVIGSATDSIENAALEFLSRTM